MDKKVYEFIASQTGENIVERKTCQCWEEFAITDKDLEFYEKISPVFDGTKYQIPAPTLCPDCRQQRRLARRNERKLYKRKCDLTGKTIISMYSDDKPYKVYNIKDWWSDKRDAMDYGKNFDFTRPFFVQFDELMRQVPFFSLIQSNCENSDYANDIFESKNCYLSFVIWQWEDCLYTNNWFWSKDCLDGYWLTKTDISYEGIELVECYNLFFSRFCFNCVDSIYLVDCKNVKNSAFCFWLSNKSYYFLNKPLSPQQYEDNVKKINNNKQFKNECIKEFEELLKNYPSTFARINNSENSIWNNISYSKNIFNCYDCHYIRDSKNIYQWWYLSDCMDTTITWSDKECFGIYETLSTAWSNKTQFSATIWDSNNVFYSLYSFNSSDLFGCIWLRNKQYCIFNKQYTKEEYEELVPKIIEHMKSTWERWEFFPVSISPFGYNETIANEYYLLDRESALAKWYKRQDKEYPINVPEWIDLVRAQDLSENISDVDDEILKKAVICEVSGKPFRIVKPELEFYRKHWLPLPRKHPDVRHLERMKLRAPRQLYLRTCDNCDKQVISVYPADSEFKVYCEECYNKEIY